ncbi:UNVERIFIED_CONTAM: hypothetical protein Sradi_0197700 [Sesamum radiatum]|uniref:Uncharacterized protein n=1 Tax=Sesamum radiatum TaxID=300843 RepID=A0AAW2W0M2_SESRA
MGKMEKRAATGWGLGGLGFGREGGNWGRDDGEGRNWGQRRGMGGAGAVMRRKGRGGRWGGDGAGQPTVGRGGLRR